MKAPRAVNISHEEFGPSRYGHAAVDPQHGASSEAGSIAGQVERGADDFLWLADAAQRVAGEARPHDFRVPPTRDVSRERTGHDRVDPHQRPVGLGES